METIIQDSIKKIIKAFLNDTLGSSNTAQLSKELGFQFNIIARWLDDSRQIYWQDFLLVCNRFELSLSNALREATGVKFSDLSSQEKLLEQIFHISPVQSYSPHISAQKAKRLQKGLTKLSLLDFLILIEINWGRSLRLMQLVLLGKSRLELEKISQDESVYMTLCSRDLNYSKVLHALELTSKKSAVLDEQELAQMVGIDKTKVSEILSHFLNFNIITKVGESYKRNKNFTDTGIQKGLSRKIDDAWSKEIQSYKDQNQESNRSKLNSAFLVYKTNKDLEKEVFKLSQKFYLELKSLVDNSNNNPLREESNPSTEATTMRVMQMQYYSPLTNDADITDVFPN